MLNNIAEQQCPLFKGEYTVPFLRSVSLIFVPSCCSFCLLLEEHLSHEQAIRVLVVELDDTGQLVRLSSEVERVGV